MPFEIELIPYSQNITRFSHMLCCVLPKDISVFEELRGEGWGINFVIPNTLSNIARMMGRDYSFSEKSLSKLGIWNLFVPYKVYDSYLRMVERSGQSESEYILN